MTRTVELSDAETKLSALVDEAASGADVVIARAGRPVARIVKVADLPRRRPPADWAAWRDRIDPDLFLEPMGDDELRAAEGDPGDELSESGAR